MGFLEWASTTTGTLIGISVCVGIGAIIYVWGRKRLSKEKEEK